MPAPLVMGAADVVEQLGRGDAALCACRLKTQGDSGPLVRRDDSSCRKVALAPCPADVNIAESLGNPGRESRPVPDGSADGEVGPDELDVARRFQYQPVDDRRDRPAVEDRFEPDRVGPSLPPAGRPPCGSPAPCRAAPPIDDPAGHRPTQLPPQGPRRPMPARPTMTRFAVLTPSLGGAQL